MSPRRWATRRVWSRGASGRWWAYVTTLASIACSASPCHSYSENVRIKICLRWRGDQNRVSIMKRRYLSRTRHTEIEHLQKHMYESSVGIGCRAAQGSRVAGNPRKRAGASIARLAP